LLVVIAHAAPVVGVVLPTELVDHRAPIEKAISILPRARPPFSGSPDPELSCEHIRATELAPPFVWSNVRFWHLVDIQREVKEGRFYL
jgi:hypothetical protein